MEKRINIDELKLTNKEIYNIFDWIYAIIFKKILVLPTDFFASSDKSPNSKYLIESLECYLINEDCYDAYLVIEKSRPLRINWQPSADSNFLKIKAGVDRFLESLYFIGLNYYASHKTLKHRVHAFSSTLHLFHLPNYLILKIANYFESKQVQEKPGVNFRLVKVEALDYHEPILLSIPDEFYKKVNNQSVTVAIINNEVKDVLKNPDGNDSFLEYKKKHEQWSGKIYFVDFANTTPPEFD